MSTANPEKVIPNSFYILPEVCAKIDTWLEKYPPEQKRSAVVPALLLVQEQNHGWLSDEAMNAVAAYLELPPIAVYEVATFYDMYHLKPVGRHKISICTNIACMLRGAEALVKTVKSRLHIDMGETTKDGLFTVCESECLAACGGAPMCQIDDRKYYENLTPTRLEAIIDQLQKESKTS